MRNAVLRTIRSLAAIRNTRAWPLIRPVYRAVRSIVPLNRLLPPSFWASLGLGVPYPFDKPRPLDRGKYPQPDSGSLQAEYRARGLDREPDTFVLYRIIGNDLVPRHRKGQSRANVAWILENEPELPGCEKRWVVNRIVDPREEQAIIQLLESHGQEYLRIPFEWDEYAKQSWDFAGLPWPGYTFSEQFQYLSGDIRERAIKRLYRHKNNYVINNNGARNAALEDGRGRAKWVLPWDGNCFVTRAAWGEIVAGVRAAPWKKYFLVPMARITDNQSLLDNGHRPEARDEPQVLFRRDAAERFDESFFYGRRPKVELFWRLGVPGKWDDWVIEPWDLPYPGYSSEAGQYGMAGWVARLFSGQQQMETGLQSENHRRQARVEAVTGMLDSLDGRVLGEQCDSKALLVYRQEKLELAREGSAAFVDELVATAATIAEPDEGSPVVERLHASLVIVLTAFFSGKPDSAAKAQRHLATLFVDPAVRLPHGLSMFRYASWRKRIVHHRQREVLVYLACLLDGVRLLDAKGLLEEPVRHGVGNWLRAMLDDAGYSDVVTLLRRDNACNAAWFDLLLASVAAWLGDWQRLSIILRDNQERFLQQFSDAGGSKLAAMAARGEPEACLQAQAWLCLGRWRCPVAGAESLQAGKLQHDVGLETALANGLQDREEARPDRYNDAARSRILPPFRQFT